MAEPEKAASADEPVGGPEGDPTGRAASDAQDAGLGVEDPTLDEPVGTEDQSELDDDTIVQPASFPELESDPAAPIAGGIDRLLDVGLTLSVELGRRQMLVQEILSLGQGSVLDLKKSSSELVDILVNGKLLAQGEVVVIDENFGVRITSLVDPLERVRRMG